MKRTLLILMLVLMIVMTACSNQTKYPDSTQPPESETTSEPTTEPEETTEPTTEPESEPEVIPYDEPVDGLGLYEKNNLTVLVTCAGEPAFHVHVKLIGDAPDNPSCTLYESVTDIYGNAHLFYEEGCTPAYIEVEDVHIDVTEARNYEIDVNEADAREDAEILFMLSASLPTEEYQASIMDGVAAIGASLDLDIPVRAAYDFYGADESKTGSMAEFTKGGISSVTKKPAAINGTFSEMLARIADYHYTDSAVKMAFIVIGDTVVNDSFKTDDLLKATRTCAVKGIQVIPIVLPGVDDNTRTVATTVAAMTNAPYIRIDTVSSSGLSSICKTVINNLCGVE